MVSSMPRADAARRCAARRGPVLKHCADVAVATVVGEWWRRRRRSRWRGEDGAIVLSMLATMRVMMMLMVTTWWCYVTTRICRYVPHPRHTII